MVEKTAFLIIENILYDFHSFTIGLLYTTSYTDRISVAKAACQIMDILLEE